MPGPAGCRDNPMPIPQPEQIGLVQPDDANGEWWITVDGKRTVGFNGDDAKERAEKYFQELKRLAHPATPPDPPSSNAEHPSH
jgi:hypothetical protein